MSRLRQLAFAVFASLALVVAGVTVYVTVTPASLGATEVAAPTKTEVPVVLDPAPTVTPSAPTSTLDPVSAIMQPWVFSPSLLSVPSIGLEGEITEYTPAMLIDGNVEPPTDQALSWYSGIPGGIPSASATNTTYVYCHTWLDPEQYPGVEPAICNNVRKLQPGAEAIIASQTETSTYVMEGSVFTVPKPELSSDPRITQATPGRLVVVSCYRPDGYDPDSQTVENVVAVFQLVK